MADPIPLDRGSRSAERATPVPNRRTASGSLWSREHTVTKLRNFGSPAPEAAISVADASHFLREFAYAERLERGWRGTQAGRVGRGRPASPVATPEPPGARLAPRC